MVHVKNYHVRTSSNGRTFVTLELLGGLEMIQSQQTGKFYATVRKCSVATTFDEEIAKSLIGSSLDGTIEKQECVPYSYTVEKTGEVIQLNYSWGYVPATMPKGTTRNVQLVEA